MAFPGDRRDGPDGVLTDRNLIMNNGDRARVEDAALTVIWG
jgi:hypothetical protein